MRSVSLNQSRWNSQKSQLSTLLSKKLARGKQALSQELRETAADTAESLAAVTFPSSSSIGLAVAAMRFDFSQVYALPGKAYKILESSAGAKVAGAFYAAWKRGDISTAQRVLRSSGSPIASIIIGQPLIPQLREKSRDKNGRVMTAYPLQLVTQADFDAHLKLAIAEIGKTASGWLACADKLGGDGNIIPWKGIDRHGSKSGTVTIEETDFGVHVKLTNNQKLARKHISPGQVARIMADSRENLISRLAQNKALSA